MNVGAVLGDRYELQSQEDGVPGRARWRALDRALQRTVEVVILDGDATPTGAAGSALAQARDEFGTRVLDGGRCPDGPFFVLRAAEAPASPPDLGADPTVAMALPRPGAQWGADATMAMPLPVLDPISATGVPTPGVGAAPYDPSAAPLSGRRVPPAALRSAVLMVAAFVMGGGAVLGIGILSSPTPSPARSSSPTVPDDGGPDALPTRTLPAPSSTSPPTTLAVTEPPTTEAPPTVPPTSAPDPTVTRRPTTAPTTAVPTTRKRKGRARTDLSNLLNPRSNGDG